GGGGGGGLGGGGGGEQEVPRRRVLSRDLLNIRLALENSLDLSGDRERRLQQLAGIRAGQPSHPRRQMNREQIVRLELREKAFGGRHARLGTAARVQLRVGLARDRRIHRVGDRQQMRTARA